MLKRNYIKLDQELFSLAVVILVSLVLVALNNGLLVIICQGEQSNKIDTYL